MPRGIYPRLSVQDRFWRKVDKNGPIVNADLGPCWVWKGALRSKENRYGAFPLTHERLIGAHIFAYKEIVGEIPKGLELDHLCRNTACVNPGHLEPVTSKENNARGYSPAAINKRKTHCVNGHEFNKKNTWIWPRNGRRICLACGKERRQRNAKRQRRTSAIPKEGVREHRASRT